MKILAKNKTETVQGFTFFAFLLLVFKWYGSEGVDILSSPFAIFCLLLCLLLALLAWDFPPLFFYRRWACVFCFFIIYIFFVCYFLKPLHCPSMSNFWAEKYIVHIICKQYIFPSCSKPTLELDTVRSDENQISAIKFQLQKREGKQKSLKIFKFHTF